MSGSLHPAEIHRRRHRQEKRNKLRAKLAAAPAGERAAIDAKLQRTYSLVPGMKPSSSAYDAATVPARGRLATLGALHRCVLSCSRRTHC